MSYKHFLSTSPIHQTEPDWYCYDLQAVQGAPGIPGPNDTSACCCMAQSCNKQAPWNRSSLYSALPLTQVFKQGVGYEKLAIKESRAL